MHVATRLGASGPLYNVLILHGQTDISDLQFLSIQYLSGYVYMVLLWCYSYQRKKKENVKRGKLELYLTTTAAHIAVV